MSLFNTIIQSLAGSLNPAVMKAPQTNDPIEKRFTKVSMHDYMLMQYRKYGGSLDPSFPEGPYIFGVRNEDDIRDSVWNDIIGILINGKIYCTLGTTDPSAYFTFNRMSPRGCFHMKACFQKNIWRLGKHRGYEALSNTGSVGPVYGWQDGNNNFLYDDGEDSSGVFAINLHHGFSTPEKIGLHSAGCQVILGKEVFEYYLEIIKSSRKVKTIGHRDSRFSYMLFDKVQVPYDKLMILAKEPKIGH